MEIDFKEKLKNEILSKGIISSYETSRLFNLPHEKVVGELKSMEVKNIVKLSNDSMFVVELTKDGNFITDQGSPELLLARLIKGNGGKLKKAQCVEKLGKETEDRGFKEGMKLKILKYNKEEDSIEIANSSSNFEEDNTRTQLQMIKDRVDGYLNHVAALEKRKLVEKIEIKYFKAERGSDFESTHQYETNFTTEHLTNGLYKSKVYKPLNFQSKGVYINKGSLHPLLKVRTEMRNLLLELGFQEMPTNTFVETSFWNFDTLFIPQQHPARDIQDTFYLTNPQSSVLPENCKELFENTKKVHEEGDYGSLGWRYKFSEQESLKNILRTHTTATTTKVLFKMAEEYKKTNVFTPLKCFSIDRVFRNENIDKTHLAEFHQIEGLIADYDIGLGELKDMFEDFYSRLGIKQLKFKPAFNPYTEPSMEIFAWHEGFKKWIEIGNSGVFRPEMLLPMGFPSNVRIIAWGLSLERPAMIHFGYDNIRKLFGHEVRVSDNRDARVYTLLNS